MNSFFKIAAIFVFTMVNQWLLAQSDSNHEVIIQNEFLKVRINKDGAELKSIKKISDNTEFLWQGNPDYWALTSPVLFPTVGVSWNDEIHYKGKAYPMKIHGFASKKRFEVAKSSAQEVWLLLKDSPETQKVYPFNYEFYIGFILDRDQLKVQWNVKNTDTKEMFFQIGGHTGFQMPDFDANAAHLGYVKLVSDKNPVQYIVKEAGKHFVDHPTVHTIKTEQDGLFPLTKDFFKNDAVVFENNQANEIWLFDKNKNPLVAVTTETPVFALWTANKFAPFVCIEPWFGRADNQNFTGDISDKKWVQKLKPNESFVSGYAIKILK